MLERLSPQELLDVRRLLNDPTKQFWPRSVVEGMLAEIDHLTAQIGAPAERRARQRYDYARLNDGIAIDLNRPVLDRGDWQWSCTGFFRLRGEDTEEPMMSRMVDGAPDDYTLRALIEKRGPLRPLQEACTVLPAADGLESLPEGADPTSRSVVRRLRALRGDES